MDHLENHSRIMRLIKHALKACNVPVYEVVLETNRQIIVRLPNIQAARLTQCELLAYEPTREINIAKGLHTEFYYLQIGV